MVDINAVNRLPYPSIRTMKKLMGKADKADKFPKHHPCSPYKYEEKMDGLLPESVVQGWMAEPAPLQ